MTSTSFIITSDDLTGGGGNSNSASFISEGDIGGTATGEGITSASYAACAGYPCTLISGGAAAPSITFTVSPNTASLGTLTTGSVATAATTVTTTTNASNGYETSCYTDGEFRTAGGAFIAGVSDGTVTAGVGEYGVGLTGADRAFADDRSISSSARIVAANAGTVTNSSVTVTFKAAVGTTNAAGSYSQTVTFVSTGSF